jgi:hypothetical protein
MRFPAVSWGSTLARSAELVETTSLVAVVFRSPGIALLMR